MVTSGKVKWLLIILHIFIFPGISSAQQTQISGQVIDRYLESMPGVSIINQNTKASAKTDKHGRYLIKATANDLLIFNSPGLSIEKRFVQNNKEPINVILINRSYNACGFKIHLSSEKEKSQVEKYYQQLQNEAYQKAKWN